MCALFFHALRSVISCSCVLDYWHETSATCCLGGLLHLVQAQNKRATVELAARRSGVFNAICLPNGSDERQQSGRIRQLDAWVDSRCSDVCVCVCVCVNLPWRARGV